MCIRDRTYTAEYLFKNKEKRHEILKACEANDEKGENCANASQAQSVINTAIKAKQMNIQQLQVQAKQLAYSNAMFKSSVYAKQNEAKLQQLNATITAEQDKLAKMVAEQ